MSKSRNKNILILFILLLVIIIVSIIRIFGDVFFKEEHLDNIIVATSTPFVANKIEVLKQTIDEKEYHAEIEIPQIKDVGDKFSYQIINRQIRDKVDQLLKDFVFEIETMNSIANESPENILSSADLPKHSLVVSVAKADYANDKYLYLEIKDHSYITGSAHPYTRTITMNFELSTGKLVTIEELAKDKKAFIDEVSRLSKMYFSQKLSSFFEEGVAPKEENFQAFTIEGGGIRFIFDQYQVAPYASGPQEFLIEYSLLNGLLNL